MLLLHCFPLVENLFWLSDGQKPPPCSVWMIDRSSPTKHASREMDRERREGKISAEPEINKTLHLSRIISLSPPFLQNYFGLARRIFRIFPFLLKVSQYLKWKIRSPYFFYCGKSDPYLYLAFEEVPKVWGWVCGLKVALQLKGTPDILVFSIPPHLGQQLPQSHLDLKYTSVFYFGMYNYFFRFLKKCTSCTNYERDTGFPSWKKHAFFLGGHLSKKTYDWALNKISFATVGPTDPFTTLKH